MTLFNPLIGGRWNHGRVTKPKRVLGSPSRNTPSPRLLTPRTPRLIAPDPATVALVRATPRIVLHSVAPHVGGEWADKIVKDAARRIAETIAPAPAPRAEVREDVDAQLKAMGFVRESVHGVPNRWRHMERGGPVVVKDPRAYVGYEDGGQYRAFNSPVSAACYALGLQPLICLLEDTRDVE